MSDKEDQLTELQNKIIETLGIYKMAPDLVGKYLSEAEELWTEDRTLRDFLGSPEVQLTFPTANRWVNIYKAFCKSAGYLIKDLIFNKSKKNWLYKTFFARDLNGNLKSIISKDNLDEWIAKAKTLSVTDFNIEKKQFDSPVPENHTCSSDGSEKKTYWDCSVCHQRHWEGPNNENKGG